MRWMARNDRYLKSWFGKNDVWNQPQSDPEEGFQISELRPDESTSASSNNVQDFNNTNSTNRQHRNQSDESQCKALQNRSDGINNVQLMIENSNMRLTAMLKESLEEISSKLKKIERNNRTESGNMDERTKLQCKETERLEKNIKNLNDTMKAQHLATRRRIERLEKKTNSGYFN